MVFLLLFFVSIVKKSAKSRVEIEEKSKNVLAKKEEIVDKHQIPTRNPHVYNIITCDIHLPI